ncbi:SPOSA6832_00302 [Sporobolomyces salmonicolor]|uniref:SPOSA6832_00302-mRNA-1:cds n=1 Tax=Sporidiobolus salmonicolor TaxID=5005 RepID=A0A0D6EG01_SPOSA|nr:SPOSA6832_00302 [Sporobolomyces salmonicolor]
MNFGAKVLDKSMNPPSGIDTTPESNPSNNPDTFADPSGEKMQALLWEGKNHVTVGEALKPRVVDPHDVVLKVTGTTVCGSDMHLLHGAIIELEKGDILGHECMGVVESVGSDVKDIKVGDRVTAGFNIGCGECFMCKKKLSSACTKTNTSSLMNAMYGGRTCGMLGYSHFAGETIASCNFQLAEYVRIAHADANVIKIPDSVPDEDALYLSDILFVTDSGVKEGDIVGIWGCGAIGLMGAKWSILKGASRIILVDNVQWRLDNVVEKMRATGHPDFPIDIINFSEVKDVPAAIHELTKPGTHGLDPTRPAGLDVALECAAGEYAKGIAHKIELALGLETDTSEILNELIESTISYGTVGVTGVYAGYTNHFNIGSIMQRGIRFIGNGQAPCHMHMKNVLETYLVPGIVKPRELFVSHRIAIEDVAKCYYEMEKKDSQLKLVKPFVATRFSNPPAPGAPQLTQF